MRKWVWILLVLALASARAEGVATVVMTGGVEIPVEARILRAMPDIALAYEESVTAQALARRLQARDSSADIYRVPVDFTFLSMMKKGYVRELSASASIQSEVAAMDEAIRALICDGEGRACAVPANLRVFAFGVNEELWRGAFGDAPLPATYGEVMDAWIVWETEIAPARPDAVFANVACEFDFAYVARMLTEAYALQCGEKDLENAKGLTDALTKLEAVRDARNENGAALAFVNSEAGPEAAVYFTTREAMDDEDTRLTWRALSFEGEAPRARAYMEVFVLNPYAAHPNEAMRVLECLCARDADPRLYAAVHPLANEPCEDPDYEARRESYLARRDAYAQALKAAEDAGEDGAKLRAGIAFIDEWLENADGNRWLLSGETIRAFRARTQETPLCVRADSLYALSPGDANDILQTLCARCASGEIGLAGCLRALSDKMEMARAENGRVE